MKLLRQFGLILLICFAGEIVHRLLKIQIPGSIIGMIFLFILLCLGIIKVDTINEITTFLLDHLAFFFVPAGVGLMAYMGILRANWIAITTISIITTIIVMVVTGHTIQFLRRGEK